MNFFKKTIFVIYVKKFVQNREKIKQIMNYKNCNYHLYYQVPVVAEPLDGRRNESKKKKRHSASK